MFVTAKYMFTVDGEGFNQSQLLVMSEMPNQETVRGKLQIKLFAAPCSALHFNTWNGHVNQEEMLTAQWKLVKISIAPERNITSHGVIANRRQYSLWHVGAGTIIEVCY
jgi:hypothetical protein